MIHENEVIVMLIALGAAGLLVVNRARVSGMPDAPLLFGAFGAFVAGWVATVVEGVAAAGFFNILEHASYAVGAVLAAAWAWRISNHLVSEP